MEWGLKVARGFECIRADMAPTCLTALPSVVGVTFYLYGVLSGRTYSGANGVANRRPRSSE